MGHEGAFAKAKVKKAGGGFGASKASRFGGPKESCEDGPSASAYRPDHGSIGSKSKKSKARAARSAGFGSTEERGSKISGQSNDAPGPGAYGMKPAVFDQAAKGEAAQHKGRVTSAAFASGSVKGLALNPSYGDHDYLPADGVAVSKSKNVGGAMFGGGDRFEKPRDVVQVDYDLPGAFDGATKAAVQDKGFGGDEKRGSKISGQANDAPAPGAYGIPGASAFEPSAMPSSAFASKSAMLPPLHQGPTDGPGPGYYEIGADNPEFAKKSVQTVAGFGSTEERGSKISGQSNDAPGPGAYGMKPAVFDQAAKGEAAQHKGRVTSAAFASGSVKGLTLNPSYGDHDYLPADGVAVSKSKNVVDGAMFGGGDRFEKPRDVVQVDYDLPGAFDGKRSGVDNKGFGGDEKRGSKISGQANDAPGPGAYLRPDYVDDDPFWA